VAVALEYSADGKPRLKMSVLRPILGCAVVVIGFWAGWRAACGYQQIARNPPAPSRLTATSRPLGAGGQYFQDVSRLWCAYVSSHEGDLPEDLYRYIVDSMPEWGVEELRWISVNLYTPPRMNKDLSRNVPWLVLRLDRTDVGEVWCLYADGTWMHFKDYTFVEGSRVTVKATEGGLDMLSGAGYPYSEWHCFGDRWSWYQAHQDRCMWSDVARCYVVHKK
jgi:hypothetical protein